MRESRSIRYEEELTSLVNLVKSNTIEGNRVIEVLRTGDEYKIRYMLKNFGNPEIADWQEDTTTLPWTDMQIDEAVKDLNIFRPSELNAIKFWAW